MRLKNNLPRHPVPPLPNARTITQRVLLCTAFLLTALCACAQDNTNNTDYFGKLKTPPTFDKNGNPNTQIPDPFYSSLLKDGNPNVPLTPEAIAAEKAREKKDPNSKYTDQTAEHDRSIHLSLTTGAAVEVLVTTDRTVKISCLRNGEVVRPTNIIVGSNDLIQWVYDPDKSPYIYITAKVALPGQTTDMFIETHEDDRIQDYVLKLMVVEKTQVSFDVLLDLTADNTPFIRGQQGSRDSIQQQEEIKNRIALLTASQNGNLPNGQTPWSLNSGNPPKAGAPGSGYQTRKFSRDDIRKYLPRMVQMAKAYDDAKQIEANGGKAIYTDSQIKKGAVQEKRFIDPITGDSWIFRPWFFQQMDSILIEAVQYNPNTEASGWPYNLIKWRVGESYQTYDTTAADPEQPAALPHKENRVWLLLQGNNIGLDNRFTPLMPDLAHRKGH